MKSVFEAMGGTYRQCGDYLIPEIALPDTPRNPIGKYGRMRHLYLKGHRRILYNAMLLDGTLWSHHTEVDKICKERMDGQIKEDFHSLDRILAKLSLQEYDQVWNLTCRLCSEHEKSAFLEGIRTAMRLTVELDDDPMLTGKAR